MTESSYRHWEERSDEAIQLFVRILDRFASLAMDEHPKPRASEKLRLWAALLHILPAEKRRV
jgi:hypothetical protein